MWRRNGESLKVIRARRTPAPLKDPVVRGCCGAGKTLRGLQESSGESQVSVRPRKVKGLFREVIEDKRGVCYSEFQRATRKSQELRDEKMGCLTDGEYSICKERSPTTLGLITNMVGINTGTEDTDAYSDWIHSCDGEVVLW